MLTTDVLTAFIYITIASIALFFIANHYKMWVATAFFGFFGSYLSWLTAGALTATTVVSNGSYIGDEGFQQLFSAVGFIMLFLTLAVLFLPVLLNKQAQT